MLLSRDLFTFKLFFFLVCNAADLFIYLLKGNKKKINNASRVFV